MNTTDEVRLALSPQALARLLAENRLYADDFRCLDQQAARRVKSMFLANLRLTPRRMAEHLPQDRRNHYAP